MELTDRIKQIYEEAGINGSQRLSEADTCERIITRLLREVAGYHFADYSSQERDAARGRPDYTVLPGTAKTWYLEAKAWSVPLNDGEAAQAMNYVNSQGKRWAVLTNGREWRLYDNHKVGVPAAEKLQAQANYPDFASIERFLSAISKQSITSGKLEEFALRESIAQQLEVGLEDPDSALVKALARELKANTLNGRQVIADFFRRKNSFNSNAETELMSETATISSPVEQEKFDEDSLVSFSQIFQIRDTLPGAKPTGLQFDQSTEVVVSTWKELLIAIIRWIDSLGKLPRIPFPENSMYMLNYQSSHRDGTEMINAHQLDLTGGKTLFVETNTNTILKTIQIEKLCKAAGISPDRIRVRLRFPKKEAL
ncbi:MAG: hypothetical protein KIT45_14695 [Fimbriimonadia bacterium]|nr:hypothetical protein [Fimbriimonadia bacterium]